MRPFEGRKYSLLVKAAGFLCACVFGEIFALPTRAKKPLFLSFRQLCPDNPGTKRKKTHDRA
jgi:hypothetical protein